MCERREKICEWRDFMDEREKKGRGEVSGEQEVGRK